jgi:orotate phosphoribosyltransferase
MANRIADALLSIGAFGFSLEKPITFKSGIISPVYVDNRRLPFHPIVWRTVLEGFAALIADQGLEFDAIAGIETAGIPHSAALGFLLQKPSLFIRKKVKDHGTKSRIEGGDVTNKKVLLLEDLVTTGGSSLAGVEALREATALVTDCLVIVDYGFSDSRNAFLDAKVTLHPLVTFTEILQQAVERGQITPDQKVIIEHWQADPWSWRP